MKRVKYFSIIFVIAMLLFIIPSISKAAVTVQRDVYSNDGSMRFNFSGLTLDKTLEYEYGFTKTSAGTVENWYLITEYTETTASVEMKTSNSNMRAIFNAGDTGYITIREKGTEEIVLEPYAVDFKIPFLKVTNYSVLDNGKKLSGSSDNNIRISIRNAGNSKAYYQYEKITDKNVIEKYKEIKEKNGDVNELQGILKTVVPTSNWINWGYWNGYSSEGLGYTQSNIQAPDTGLYYMWVYFSGSDAKNIYGYILVDNLQPEISLDGISLPKTKTVELGKTLTLTPTFNPEDATNKIVTWTSSDETVATVSNAGVITPKKLGSTIITVTSQDGNRQATCTVTVTEKVVSNGTQSGSNNSGNSNSGNSNSGNSNSGNSSSGNSNSGSSNSGNNGSSNNNSTSTSQKDNTTAAGKIPQTGIGMGLTIAIIGVMGACIVVYSNYRKLKDIK